MHPLVSRQQNGAFYYYRHAEKPDAQETEFSPGSFTLGLALNHSVINLFPTLPDVELWDPSAMSK